MVFSSPSFLFLFLPFFFFVYFGVPRKLKNLTLLLGSLVFYACDGSYAFLILLASIPVNYFMGLAIAACGSGSKARFFLALGVAANLLPLMAYKYLGFLIQIANELTGINVLHVTPWLLPAGISFFTFQGISYLVDIYRGVITPARRLVDFGMYHTSFPQLIAGPIVRYAEIEKTIERRAPGLADIHEGLVQFCFGLSKKIIIADTMGSMTDRIWHLPEAQLDASLAWLAAIAYMLQIFFDFSGYSDMAIGLARVMGFDFPINFDQPYRATTMTEFWRRWHMTLTRWFRDYVYIPLGGNRRGSARTYANLFIVFLLCGLWHGAAYTFVLWGLYHGLWLVIERVLKKRFDFHLSGIGGWAITFILVLLGWVLFRADNIHDALLHYRTMFGLRSGSEVFFDVPFYMTPDKTAFMAAGFFLALFPFDYGKKPRFFSDNVIVAGKSIVALGGFLYSALLIAANGFNPFIYFRF